MRFYSIEELKGTKQPVRGPIERRCVAFAGHQTNTPEFLLRKPHTHIYISQNKGERRKKKKKEKQREKRERILLANGSAVVAIRSAAWITQVCAA